MLEEHHYNSVSNFLKLYMDFKRSGEADLAKFFRTRTPEITDDHHTCVGLGLELRKRVANFESKFPGLTERLFMVSSEEYVEDLNEYIGMGKGFYEWTFTVEKEHVMMALRLDINGRKGIMLCDPGYHVARVVTVMEDELYPHTGWFTQSDEDGVRKDYCYTYNKFNKNFVNWTDCETRNGVEKIITSLVFVQKPYLTAVDLTERRNFVYDFRSLLARDMKGHLIAGLYFPVKRGRKDFTVFYQEDNRKEKVKMDFTKFLDPSQLDEKTLHIINKCNEQLRLSPDRCLLQYLTSLAYLIHDEVYVDQLLTINQQINEMA